MSRIKACNVQDMSTYMRGIEKTIITISPHWAAAFRERMQITLAKSPRLYAEGSSSGIFEADVVYSILREAQTMICQFGLSEKVLVKGVR